MSDDIEIWVTGPLDPAAIRDVIGNTRGLHVARRSEETMVVTRGLLRRPSFSIHGPEAADFADHYPHLIVTGLAGTHRYLLSRDAGSPVDDQSASEVARRVSVSANGFTIDSRDGGIWPAPRVAHVGVETPTRRSTWSPEVLEALRGVPRFFVTVSETQIARSLWDYAEDALAERALAMTRTELLAIRRICAVFENPSYPLPIEGQNITHNHVSAMAAIALFEGGIRPLARTRRRPQKQRPGRFTPIPSPFSDSIGEPDWY
ncbi:hypothetical protein [Microbacterium sp. B19]|uniref:hypothetical protein n=1 Tax=Microbacterium sp. B19 TaxID=96765 RepID=UPI00034C3CE2|nr:hypothetical protein [Microbacterium sp. B19]